MQTQSDSSTISPTLTTDSNVAAVPPVGVGETGKPEAATRDSTKRQIRGSSLLLAGQVLSKGSNFVVQLLIVRYLSQSDYGAFAYALSIVAMAEGICTFGLDRAVTRFLPIYHERERYDQMVGTILMVLGTIVGLGVATAVLLFTLRGWLDGGVIKDQQAFSLLMILIFLAPVRAIDNFLLGMFAVFSSPRAIFFRKSILAPALKIGVVLSLIFAGQGPSYLASGYLLSTLFAVVVYSFILIRHLRREKIWQHLILHEMNIPWKEVLAFTIPLLTSDLVYIVIHTFDVVMLEYYGSVRDVASLRAVRPLAMMNQVVLASFATLFTPMAARLFARHDTKGITEMYWQTAVWIAVISFPIFVVTFSIAGPVTVLLYGNRYADSATILAILGVGCYFHASLGFNGLTLKVYGKVRPIVLLNLAAAILSLGLNLLLIPRFGAMGAAFGTSSTLIAHNVLKQFCLHKCTGVELPQRKYLRVYLIIIASAIGLWIVQVAFSPPVVVSIPVAFALTAIVFRCNRDTLNAHQIFPGLLKIPMARLLVGA
jgi:O-antigen/teichoic acid export membrane protein